MSSTTHSDFYLRKQAALISLLVGFGMLAMKGTAFLLTHSAAIFSDALESILHIAATSMAFYSVILSARPADDSHPYGHGKIEFFSAGTEGGLIVMAALGIVYEAVRGMIVGRTLTKLDLGIFLTLTASVVNLVLGWFLIRRGKATDSLTLVADGKHVLTDSYTSFGVVVGLGLVELTGFELLDPIVAMAVAANILFSGYRLVRLSVSGLMDESDIKTLKRIGEIVKNARTPEWIELHHLRVIRSGRMHNLDFHLTIPFYWSVQRAHDFQQDVTRTISTGLSDQAQVLIHLDPCNASFCRICKVHPCEERKSPQIDELEWTVSKMIGGPITNGD